MSRAGFVYVRQEGELILQSVEDFTYEQRVAMLKHYILVKLSENDYHAVSDAANDLRVLEAEYVK